MDTVSAEIRIGGDIKNTVIKQGRTAITVPEIAVLIAIHGENAVTVFNKEGTVKRTNSEERTRLREKYNGKVVDSLYPGARPQMDTTYGSEAPEVKEDTDGGGAKTTKSRKIV